MVYITTEVAKTVVILLRGVTTLPPRTLETHLLLLLFFFREAPPVGSVRLSFIVASSFSESRKRMAGEELSLFTANLNVKVVPERFVHSVRLTNKLIVVSIICVL